MNVRISVRAQSDLDSIYTWLFAANPDAAENFIQMAKSSTVFLGHNPLAGPLLKWSKRRRHLRYWVIGRTNFLIFYLAGDDEVNIERILDGRRDVSRIIERRLENPR